MQQPGKVEIEGRRAEIEGFAFYECSSLREVEMREAHDKELITLHILWVQQPEKHLNRTDKEGLRVCVRRLQRADGAGLPSVDGEWRICIRRLQRTGRDWRFRRCDEDWGICICRLQRTDRADGSIRDHGD